MVDEGFLTENQLLDALAEQNRTGTPLGKVLVDLGFVSPGAVANALAEQHGGLLRTEYGTSAGLRELAGRAPIRTEAPPASALPTPPVAAPPTPPAPALGSGLRLAQPAAAPAETPAPVAAPPAPVEPPAAPEPAAPEPEPELEPEPLPPAADASSARIEELESQLHAVLTERNSLAQSFNELQARLGDAAQAHEAGVAAEVQERVGALESQLQAAVAQREELERAQQHAAGRIVELEGRLAETAESRHELDAELQTLRTVAAGRDAALERIAGLEAELAEARANTGEDLGGRLQELAERRDAAEARAQALEHDLAQAREQAESQTARVEALESELGSLREQSNGRDEQLAAQVSGLEDALRSLTAERDAAVARTAELEPELESLRDRLRHASTPVGSAADVAELRRQLAARERRLAESVGEIAKMNREHRALLQLVERQFQLEDSTTSVPEPKGEAAHVLFVPSATGYTLVERDGVAPEAGDVVEVDGADFVVRRHGPSPLPGPRRRCAYLERA